MVESVEPKNQSWTRLTRTYTSETVLQHLFQSVTADLPNQQKQTSRSKIGNQKVMTPTVK